MGMVVQPTEDERQLLESLLSSFRAARAAGDGISCGLDDGRVLQVPAFLEQTIEQVLIGLQNGGHVAIVPYSAKLTTQQAAEFLGMSRPHLIKILKRGDIPFSLVGTHRKVAFLDLIMYQKKEKQRREALLAEIDDLYRELEAD